MADTFTSGVVSGMQICAAIPRLAGVIGHGLRVISRRRGNHAAPAFFGGEQQNFVERAALLEGAGHLQIFELEEDRVAGQLRKRLRAHEGRKKNRAADALAAASIVLIVTNSDVPP